MNPDQLLERLAILEGIEDAVNHPHEVLDLIVEAEDPEDARDRLVAVFGWHPHVATAILDMQWKRLPGGEKQKVTAQINDMREQLGTVPVTQGDRVRFWRTGGWTSSLAEPERRAIEARWSDEAIEVALLQGF